MDFNESDGKRPDDLTLIPWRKGCSYLVATSTIAGNAAACVRKKTIYVVLSNRYLFFHIAIESRGPLSHKATSFVSDLGRRIIMSVYVSDARETSFLFLRLSVALLRCNTVCVSNTFCDLLVNGSG